MEFSKKAEKLLKKVLFLDRIKQAYKGENKI